jgi:membrane protease YdiL (CAAX protease family)
VHDVASLVPSVINPEGTQSTEVVPMVNERRHSVAAAFSPLLLYGAVIAGMYLFRSGWAAILGYHLAIVAVLASGGGFSQAGRLVRGWHWGFGAAATGACLFAGALIYWLWPLIALDGLEMGPRLAQLGLSGWSWVAFIASYSLVNPWLEELYWRGWYPSRLERPFISDLLFAGYHLFVLVLFVGVAWAGLAFLVLVTTARIWRALSQRCDGLLIPCVSHLAADISVIVAAVLLMR